MMYIQYFNYLNNNLEKYEYSFKTIWSYILFISDGTNITLIMLKQGFFFFRNESLRNLEPNKCQQLPSKKKTTCLSNNIIMIIFQSRCTVVGPVQYLL